jgi:triosephosphate isomerase
MSRKIVIAGNWKMNKTRAEAADLVKSLVTAIGNKNDITVVIGTPFTALETAGDLIGNAALALAAQNMCDKASGAYTGETSAAMLRDLHVSHVILGHSERRAIYGETDALINKKVLAALENNLKPLFCIGETLAEREAGKTLEVNKTQLLAGLEGVTPAQAEHVIVAYEPVWAIGTGKTATPEMAQEVHAFIRKTLAGKFGDTVAQKIRIVYGGSMKPDNADSLLSQPDIDGGLIGGASLVAKDFLALVASGEAAQAKRD